MQLLAWGALLPFFLMEDSHRLHFRAADKNQACPLCGHEKYCWLGFDPSNEIVKITCQWTTEQPEGWHSKGHSKDGRPIWERNGFRRRRKKYPNLIEIPHHALTGAPEWHPTKRDGAPKLGDYISIGGTNLGFFLGWEKEGRKNFAKYADTPSSRTFAKAQDKLVALATADGDEHELEIEYLYPDPSGKPLGMVRRRQWSDRRYIYCDSANSPLKSKQIRPFHWGDSGWVSGMGNKDWPLYRQDEAIAEAERGGFIFAVGGEQAVEACRSLGLVATSPQGGEAKCRQIITKLKDAFKSAKAAHKKPLLISWPDNDITGDQKFGELLVRDAQDQGIPCVSLMPSEIWPQCPPGGDVTDWIASGEKPEIIRQRLTTGIDLAIERQEQEEATAELRRAWKAPESRDGELGRLVRNPAANEDDGDDLFTFKPQTNFDLWVEQELASEEGGGLLIKIKRSDDRDTYRIFLKSSDYTTASKFEDALKRALGSNILCVLTTNEIKALIRARLLEYHRDRKGKVYRLIDRVGQQENGVWVFEHGQLSKFGDPITEGESLQVWNQELTRHHNVPSPRVADPDPNALPELAETMQACLGKNFMIGLFTLGYAAAGCHYQQIMKIQGAFPILNLWGNPGTGKSIMAVCGLSLVGMHDAGMMKDLSISAAYERLKLAGSLVHCLDDPRRSPELDEFLKGFYNGKPRIVRGKEEAFNVQTPHSPLMVTSNFSAGDRNAATMSRILSVWCGRFTAGDRNAFPQLRTVQQRASGALPNLIRLGYPKAEIEALELELLPFLPKAHARVSASLSLILWYTLAIAKLANLSLETEIWDFALEFADFANDSEQSGSYLPDFLSKLEILRSEDKIGDWNVRDVSTEEGEFQALYLPGVWRIFDATFKPEYNENVIKQLLLENGAKESRQRFHQNESVSRQWHAGNLKGHVEEGEAFIPKGSPPSITRRCLLVPVEANSKIEVKNLVNDVNSVNKSPSMPDTESVSLVDKKIFLMSTDVNGCQRERAKKAKNAPKMLPSKQAVDIVDMPVNGVSTGSKPYTERVPASVDIVDTIFEKTSTSSENQLPPKPRPGDVIVIKAIAKRVKYGSSELETAHEHRWAKGKKRLSMEDLKRAVPEVWKSLQEPCTVKAVKEGRVQVVCPAGLVHVFEVGDVAVFPAAAK